MAARKILAALAGIIETKLYEIAPKEYADAIERKDAAKMRVLAGDALVALKVREKTNKNDGVLVEMIQKTSGGGKGQAWCEWTGQTLTAFVEWKLGVKSRSPVSGSCAYMRTHTPKDMIFPLAEAIPGDQIYLIHKNGLGHSAEVRRRISKTVLETNEGNTTQGVAGGEVIREGGGMYRCERSQSMWAVCTRPFPPTAAEPAPVKDKPAAEADGIPKFGEQSDRVATLQKALNEHAGAKLVVDARFGALTKTAVSKFQKANGLTGSGIIGKKTMTLLGARMSDEFRQAKTSEILGELRTILEDREALGHQEWFRIFELIDEMDERVLLAERVYDND